MAAGWYMICKGLAARGQHIMQLAGCVSPRLLSACFLALGVWLASFSVNHAHAQATHQVSPQLMASDAFALEPAPRKHRARPKPLIGPLVLTTAGAATFLVPYFVAVFTDLFHLAESSAFADPAHGESCDYCQSSRTLLIPVAGPLIAAGEPLNPFSKGVSIALGVTQAVGLAMLVSGLLWLKATRSNDRPRRGLQFGMMGMPLPGGAMIGMRLALGDDASGVARE